MIRARWGALAPVVCIALAILPSVALAQEEMRDAAPLARLQQVLDAETYRVVMQTVRQAEARSLPIDPLVDRALEGAMKRAPGPRIQGAVASLAERLAVARSALAPAPTAADITAGAGALAVGVPRDVLQTIRAVQPNASVAVPLGVLTELVTRRVPIDRATTMVVQLLQRGATPTQLVALGEDVQRDIAAGLEPGAAFDLRTRGVASTLPGGIGATGDMAGAPGRDLGTNAGAPPATTRPKGGRRP